MAGTATPNLPASFKNPTGQRAAEVPLASWTTGGAGATNVGCGGFPATGEYKSGSVNNAGIPFFAGDMPLGQAIGRVAVDPYEAIQIGDTNDTFSFQLTTGTVAPGAAIIAGVLNRSGLTLPSGVWCWGTRTV